MGVYRVKTWECSGGSVWIGGVGTLWHPLTFDTTPGDHGAVRGERLAADPEGDVRPV
jgi:hypothetical protein